MHHILDISNGNNQTMNIFVLQSRAYFNKTGTYDVKYCSKNIYYSNTTLVLLKKAFIIKLLLYFSIHVKMITCITICNG